MRATRIIGAARPVHVETDAAGIPAGVAGARVACVRDEWRVDEGWWTGRRTSRRYFDLVLADGRNRVVYRDGRTGEWWSQRG